MSDEQRREVGAYLREIRQGLRLTQTQAAEQVGISVPMLSIIERGHKVTPSESTLLKMAKGYGIDASDLLLRAGYVKEEYQERAKAWDASTSLEERLKAWGASASQEDSEPDTSQNMGEVESHVDAVQLHSSPAHNKVFRGVHDTSAGESSMEDVDEVLDWAIAAIALDRRYPLNSEVNNRSLPPIAKALVIRYYQDRRGRTLLSEDEMKLLNRLIHGGDEE